MTPGVEVGADAFDGLGLAGHGDAAPLGRCEKSERAADAVGEAEVGVPSGGGQLGVWVVGDPPSGKRGAVELQRVGQSYEVVENPCECVVSRLLLQKKSSDAGQPAE